MADNHESTMKWKVDIGELKSAMQDAKRSIAQANAEFKTATAGMDKWSKSIDGVEAKINQLNSTLPEQKKILENLEKQYQYTVQTMGENSAAAHDLQIKIEEQKATIVKTETSIKSYTDKLNEMKAKEAESETATGKLSKTIADQEAELTKLKRAYANAVLQYGENSDEAKKLAKQVDKLSSELVDNKKKLSDADKAADSLDKTLEKTDKDTKEITKGFTVMKGVLANLVTKGIDLAITGMKSLAQTAKAAWEDYDVGEDIIIAKTGAIGKSAESLKEAYKNVGKQVVGTFDEIGTAVGEVNTRFGVIDEELEDLSVKFLKFAKLNGVDVNQSIDTVQATMAAWGITADQTGVFLDTLNKAGQDTGVSVLALADSMKTNAPALMEMGFSASDAAMFLANLDKNGVGATAAMTGLKKALTNAAKEGKPMDKAMQDIEKSIKNAKTSTDAIRIATELFGDKAGAAIATAVRNGKLSFAELGTAMTDFEGNVETTFESTQDAPDKLALAVQKARIKIAEITSELMEKYSPQIEEAINSVSDVVETFFKGLEAFIGFIEEHGAEVVATIGGIAAAFIAFKAISFVSTAIGVFQTFFGAIKAGTGIMAAFNAVGMANPIALITAAVVGLIAAFAILWNKSEGFREFWINLWETCKNAAIAAWQWITNAASAAWNGIKTVWSTVKNWFKTTVVDPVSNFFSNFWSKLKTGASAAWEGIKKPFKAAGDWFGGIFDNVAAVVKAPINFVIRGLNKMIRGLNKISFDVPDWVPIIGGKTFGFNISEIPELARGGVLGRGQLGLLEGDGAEAVVPLEKNKQWIAAVVKDMLHEINIQGLKSVMSGHAAGVNGASGSVENMTQNISFTQTINSPKAVDRLTLYRETNNLLFGAKVRLANV